VLASLELRSLPAECRRDCAKSRIKTRGAAHAVATGQGFGRIVRHTWRIAAFGKQPELESGASIALACMVPGFSYDCDQRAAARSNKPEVPSTGSKEIELGLSNN
jgi:hypothetical protein